MDPELAASPLVKAVLAANANPQEGLPQLLRLIEQAEVDGRRDDVHVLSDNFIGAACRAVRQLDVAEQMARRLVAQQPDKHHLNHLAKTLELQGKTAEAADVGARAATARDEHSTPEIDEAIREAEESLASRK